MTATAVWIDAMLLPCPDTDPDPRCGDPAAAVPAAAVEEFTRKARRAATAAGLDVPADPPFLFYVWVRADPAVTARSPWQDILTDTAGHRYLTRAIRAAQPQDATHVLVAAGWTLPVPPPGGAVAYGPVAHLDLRLQWHGDQWPLPVPGPPRH